MREGENFKSNILREKAEVEVSAPVWYGPSTEPRQAMHMKGSCKNRPWAQRVPGVFSMALLSWRTFVSDLALEILVSLSCSNTISKSCQKPVLCFVWKAFLHYLHTSNTSVVWSQVSPIHKVFLHFPIWNASVIPLRPITSDFVFNLQLSNLSCNYLDS